MLLKKLSKNFISKSADISKTAKIGKNARYGTMHKLGKSSYRK